MAEQQLKISDLTDKKEVAYLIVKSQNIAAIAQQEERALTQRLAELEEAEYEESLNPPAQADETENKNEKK